jgi:uncharacterized radical SAM protein YgiQ
MATLPVINARHEPPRTAVSADLLRVGRTEQSRAAEFLPTSLAEMKKLGWEQADVVFVTGDAYIDHPSFAMALLGRVLEAAGWRVAILSQPGWQTVDDFLSLGPPRLFWAVSAGNMDSMINHYTAAKKVRNDDSYSPGGRPGQRPDRATNAYVQRCREANKRFGEKIPIVAGGVEASLRRVAHYDYWSDTVRPSILQSSKADMVVHGMGEAPILEIARRLGAGEQIRDLRDMRSTAWFYGKNDLVPEGKDVLALPSFETVKTSREEFARATFQLHEEMNSQNGRVMTQAHGDRTVVIRPGFPPLSETEMDAIYDLPFARRPHPGYRERIPAFEIIKTSVTVMRGCFGGCTFCSITMHQGRPIQSRSKKSILKEVGSMHKVPGFSGVISDLGGPTANMYKMRCSKPEVEKICRRPSCVHPSICSLLDTSHSPIIELMREAREVKGIRQVHIASGVRMDLARKSAAYLDELVQHHVGGHLKVAPEHASDRVLNVMKKPSGDDFDAFGDAFKAASKRAGKEQYLVPYYISSHPGADLADAIELASYLKRHGYRPRQVQDFIPAPMDIATAIYHTGLDPKTLKPVPVARKLRDRSMQRALLQFFLPQNWFTVRDALRQAGREDLIGPGADCLIGHRPPEEALQAQRVEHAEKQGRKKGRGTGRQPKKGR